MRTTGSSRTSAPRRTKPLQHRLSQAGSFFSFLTSRPFFFVYDIIMNKYITCHRMHLIGGPTAISTWWTRSSRKTLTRFVMDMWKGYFSEHGVTTYLAINAICKL